MGSGCGSTGGGGSGGAIRIIATTLSGNGTISAVGGTFGTNCYAPNTTTAGSMNMGGSGGEGRIRLEADTITRTAASTPAAIVAALGAVFVPGIPTLRFVCVAGVEAPALPSGRGDIVLPKTTNPVTVEFAATGVPLGTTIKLAVKADSAALTTVTSSPLSGSVESSAASVNVTLPAGPSVLQATTTFTITTAMGDALSIYAKGERVEQVELAAGMQEPSTVTLITASGKRYTLSGSIPAMSVKPS